MSELKDILALVPLTFLSLSAEWEGGRKNPAKPWKIFLP